jgi:hypothetical protein
MENKMTVAKKAAPKKAPVPKKAVAKKIEVKPEPAPVETGNRVLYTIRLEPSIIAKLHDMAKKLGTTHAAVARGILQEGV